MPPFHPPTNVTLIGRTNVGKSTIFNRLVDGRRALVSPEPGTTRDRNRAWVTWAGSGFWLEDTGGLDPAQGDPAAQATTRQAERALREAALVLFVVDGRIGLTPQDRELAKRVRRSQKPVILVVNKIDNLGRRNEASSLGLGFADTVLISAINGSGIGDMLDLILSRLAAGRPHPTPHLRLALVGKTNVGKSSLFNALLHEERSIVLATPHTTRDAVREQVAYGGVELELIDTAGLRRQLAKAPRLEQQSVAQTLTALENIDVALLIINGATQPTWQDQRLGELVVEAGVAALVAINKADLVPQTEREGVVKRLARWLSMLEWAPVHWVSAKTGRGSAELIPAARAAAAAWQRQLTQQELQDFTRYLHRTKTTRNLPLGSFKQTGTRPPSFVLQLQTKENIPVGVGGWIARELRDRLKLIGTPLRMRLEGLRKKR